MKVKLWAVQAKIATSAVLGASEYDTESQQSAVLLTCTEKTHLEQLK